MNYGKKEICRSGAFPSPFESLKKLIKKLPDQKHTLLKPLPEPLKKNKRYENADDSCLFLREMADVKPLSGKKYVSGKWPSPCLEKDIEDNDSEVVNKLHRLVDTGDGFIVSDTPEYMEGRGYHVSSDITRRLHRGDFAIQDHIDLHGLNSIEAEKVFNRFMKDAVISGKRAVLIIHGRGLSSPKEPVLKTKTCEWLTRGPWRKWVIAFTSARSCDGGAGATYVLLRSRPLTKKDMKKKT